MSVTNQTELLLALEREHFDTVLNTAESDYVDFKEAPYHLKSPNQKWELAKDVAAFANSQGGVIVMGYRTNRPQNALVDQAVQHRPIQKALINWDAYRQTIGAWVYPHIEGLTPLWFPADGAVDSGVFAIVIPPQLEATKYFVVRELDRPDGTFPGALGVPTRQGDVVSWIKPETVHHLIREALGVRRSGFTRAIATDQAVLNQGQQDRVQARCLQVEDLAGWPNVPFIAFHSIPGEPIRRPNDFYAESGLRRELEHTEALRAAGFHIGTDAPVDIQIDGSLATAESRRALWLSPDGFFSAACRADEEFLGWYINQGGRRPIVINSRVLAEFTLEFTRFFHKRLKPLFAGPWSLWLSLVGLDRDGGVVLGPEYGRGACRGPLQPTSFLQVKSLASPGQDAYQLLVEFYALFGLPPDGIQFVEAGSVSESLLLAEMGK